MQAWTDSLRAKADLRGLGEPQSSAYVTPVHRRPTDAQISGMYKQCRRRERIDRNPLLAVQVMAMQDPSRLYWYASYVDTRATGCLTHPL